LLLATNWLWTCGRLNWVGLKDGGKLQKVGKNVIR
jgi:hypothetical protein